MSWTSSSMKRHPPSAQLGLARGSAFLDFYGKWLAFRRRIRFRLNFLYPKENAF